MTDVSPGRALLAPETRFLREGWSFCSTSADAHGDPADLDRIEPSDWTAVRLPCTVASALRDHAGTALDSQGEIDGQDHWFRCEFTLGSRGDGAAELWLHGLATICEIWLNGQRLGESTNMFVRTTLDVRGRLSERNLLVLCFRALGPRLGARRTRARWRTRLVAERNLRFHRTSLLGRMASWCPPTPAVGPWRDIELRTQSTSGLRCTRARLEPRMQGQGARLGVEIELEIGTDTSWSALSGRASMELEVEGLRWPLIVEASSGSRLRVHGEARWPEIEPWWPHTHGAPRRYVVRLHATIAGAESALELGRVGFRRVEVVGPPGPDFRIEVNGLPIFCRGTCWTPVDAIALATTPEKLREALVQARDAGMNMLRVAGTTVYEEDGFYALCDELGILVWQDFMFATLDYPAEDPEFLASVTTEVEQLLDRTRSHACLAVLCGNSEGQQQPAMLGLEQDSWSSALFDERLPELCARHRPDVPYWTSTPSGGELPFHTRAGTSHYFGVGAYRRPLSDARVAGPRFMTECLALANVPGEQGPDTTPRERVPRDSGADWDFAAVTDYYVASLFGVMPDEDREPAQAAALRRAASAEVLQRTQAVWRDASSGCGGSLVWLHRDPWSCAGWGVLDAAGRPKSAYYGLRRAWAPVAITIVDDGLNGLRLQIHNDRDRMLEAEVELVLLRVDGTRIREHRRPVELAAHGQLDTSVDAWLGGFVDSSHAYRFGPREFDVCVARLVVSAEAGPNAAPGTISSEALHWPFGLDWRDPAGAGLRARWLDAGPAELAEDGFATLEIAADRFLPCVSLAVRGGMPEDNFFALAPDRGRRVRIEGVGLGLGLGLADSVGVSIHALGLEEAVELPERACPDVSGRPA